MDTPTDPNSNAAAGQVQRPVRPAVAEALERLQHVDLEIWDDITSALESAKEDHFDPGLDELDCTLLLDLLWLYRHAEPLLTTPPETLRLARVALDESEGAPIVCDWMNAALKVCRAVLQRA